jgi:hypothetical protein
MNRLLIISTFIVLTADCLFAQGKDPLVKDIRSKYNEIRINLNAYDTTTIDIWGESAEGGLATAYHDNEDIKLIEVIWFGETGKRQVEYYFNEGNLIFAFNQNIYYNRPIFWDEEAAREDGDTEVFDLKKAKVSEDRYYFANEELFLWLDNDKNEQDLRVAANVAAAQDLIAHCYKMKAELKK